MNIKALIDEDFVNFKECSMFIGFPTCSWKCGKGLCQNSSLATSEGFEVSTDFLVNRYILNPISKAIVCGGLEPMDSFKDLFEIISKLRASGENGKVVIYTGYNPDEISKELKELKQFKNIIFKFGRYIPNRESRFDEVLGVTLQSDNQYGEELS